VIKSLNGLEKAQCGKCDKELKWFGKGTVWKM